MDFTYRAYWVNSILTNALLCMSLKQSSQRHRKSTQLAGDVEIEGRERIPTSIAIYDICVVPPTATATATPIAVT